MSQHSSLKASAVGVSHRNVLKRHERVRNLKESEKWGARESVYNLPKLKLLKIKVKKEKAAKETAASAEGNAAPAQAAPTAGKAPAGAKQPEKAKAENPKEKGK